ncbi:hypothetical protein AB833_28755 [Chromatiales bacterium (ex Bugula neritina AB1)]|nr:hypothetical protein AB833_28755 [Chromatiales bacterium (ex Bugula neritina AB1)]
MAFSSLQSCPSCGVAISDVSAHTRSTECPHCANWLYLSNNGWTTGGLFEHALDAPSMLRLGRSGVFSDRRFVVAGRLRIAYASGFWDEWWLEFDDGTHHWLEEDDGRYRLHKNREMDTSGADLSGARVGSNINMGGDRWFVTEKINAQVAGTEGSLPVAVTPGEQVLCIDVIGGGKKLSIEASGNDVTISQSLVVSGADLRWD